MTMTKTGFAASVQYPAAPATPYVKCDVQYPVAAAPAATAPSSSAAADAMGDVADIVNSDSARYVAGAALVYHGYRRTRSIFWALLYGLAGKEIPVVAVPVALAQGFGRKKECP